MMLTLTFALWAVVLLALGQSQCAFAADEGGPVSESSTFSVSDLTQLPPALTDDAISYSGFFLSVKMPLPRSDMEASLFNYDFGDEKGSRIYLVGGCVANQTCTYSEGFLQCACPKITAACDYFTPDTNEWAKCASAPTARFQHATAWVKGKLYLLGGHDVNGNLLYSVDVYDPITNRWRSPHTWSGATSNGAAFSTKDLIYVIGGYDRFYNTSGYVSTLNVTSGQWNNNYPPMPTGRGDIRVATLDGVNFHVIGGFAAPNFCAPSDAVEAYNVETNKWTVEANLLIPRGDVALGVLGGNIFTIGGETIADNCLFSVPVSAVSRYIVQSNKWLLEDKSPRDLFRYASASYNSSLSPHTRAIYLFGGQGKFVGDPLKSGYYPIESYTIKYFPIHASPAGPPTAPLTDGAIAGIVIGGVAFLGIVACLVVAYLIYRRRYYSHQELQSAASKNVLVEEFNDDYDDNKRMAGIEMSDVGL